MKNTDNTIKNLGAKASTTEISTTQNLLVGNTEIRKSTLDMMFDSCNAYNSRVWNVVKADMREVGESNKIV